MYECPDCQSTELEISVNTWAKLDQSDADNIQTDTEAAENHDHEWDQYSIMRCRDCNRQGTAEEFEVKDDFGNHDGNDEDDDEAGKYECQNCGIRLDEDELNPVKDISERVAPGEPIPAGECPDCGALCQDTNHVCDDECRSNGCKPSRSHADQDLCDQCGRSGVEIVATDDNGKSTCVFCEIGKDDGNA